MAVPVLVPSVRISFMKCTHRFIESQPGEGASGSGLSASSPVFPLVTYAGEDAGMAGQEAGATAAFQSDRKELENSPP